MQVSKTCVRTVYTNRYEMVRLLPKMPRDLQSVVQSLVGAIEGYYRMEDWDREFSFNDWDGSIFNYGFYKIEDFDIDEVVPLVDWIENNKN